MIKSLLAVLIILSSYLLVQPVALAVSYEITPSSRVILQVIPGMTVDTIIGKLYPQNEDIWPQIKNKLIEINPNSFVQYSDRLLRGARLKLVDIKRIHEKLLLPKTNVGYVAKVKGRANVRDINGDSFPLETNSQIYEGDRISTDYDSSLYVLMDDGAEVHLKEDSEIKITEYVITTGYGKESSSIFDLLRGGLRKISGSIGSSALANYQVQTGLATIGIRGTEYVIKLCKQDDCTQTVSRNDPDAKLHAVVLEGVITLTTDDDVQILMAVGEYGTASQQALLIENEMRLPVGFLDEDETHKFDVTIPEQIEQQRQEESSSSWYWALGLLLLL